RAGSPQQERLGLLALIRDCDISRETARFRRASRPRAPDCRHLRAGPGVALPARRAMARVRAIEGDEVAREDDFMSRETRAPGVSTPSLPPRDRLLEQYGWGPLLFAGTGDALYERHLLFDRVLDPAAVGARERYEAIARSVRDVLSQR